MLFLQVEFLKHLHDGEPASRLPVAHQLVHFVTLSEASADVRAMLKRFIHELRELADGGTAAASTSGNNAAPAERGDIFAVDSIEQLQAGFLDALRAAAAAVAGAPVLLFVDDVTGGLASGAQAGMSITSLLCWLAAHLPQGVFLVLTATCGQHRSTYEYTVCSGRLIE